MMIGVDYHPGFQQIAFLVEETGECGERRLNHSDGEAEKFYRDLKARGISVRVGMETTGYSHWFDRRTQTSPQSDLNKVALRLNQRPRQALGFHTPVSKLQ